MITLTIFGHDGSQQVLKTTEAILTDQSGKPLTPLKLDEKVREVARDVLKQNYKFHRYRVNR